MRLLHTNINQPTTLPCTQSHTIKSFKLSVLLNSSLVCTIQLSHSYQLSSVCQCTNSKPWGQLYCVMAIESQAALPQYLDMHPQSHIRASCIVECTLMKPWPISLLLAISTEALSLGILELTFQLPSLEHTINC